MPRPSTSSSSLISKRRPSSSSPACCCTCTPSTAPSARRTPQIAAYATASVPSAPPTPPPVLDFLYPRGGFGFFSRSLPPIVDASPPSSSSPAFYSPPPPPPRPEKTTFDVRSWRAKEGLAALGWSQPRRTFAAQGVGLVGRCVCGREKMGCLRCRGKSTSAGVASTASERRRDGGASEEERIDEREKAEDERTSSLAPATPPPPIEATATGRGGEGHEKEVEWLRVLDEADLRGAGAGETYDGHQGSSEQLPLLPPPSIPPPRAEKTSLSRPPHMPAGKLASLLALHAPASLPSRRGLPVPAGPSKVTPSQLRHRARRLSPDEAHASLDILWEEASDETFLETLSPGETLDLIKAFSRVARAVPKVMEEDADPLTPPQLKDSHTARRTFLRHLASERMLVLLRRTRLWRPVPSSAPAFANIPTSKAAPASVTNASAAATFLDAVALSDDLSAFDLSKGIARHALQRIFRPPPLPDGLSSKQREKREYALAGERKTILWLLFEVWTRAAAASSSEAKGDIKVVRGRTAEQALSLMHGWDAIDLLDVHPPTPHSAEERYFDLLRRRYGVVLSQLQPSPPRWMEDKMERAKRQRELEMEEGVRRVVKLDASSGEPEGLHIVRCLARAGSALRALQVWQVLEMEVSTVMGRDEEFFRLRALTALVDGLTMERFYEDANALATETEKLAQSLQVEAAEGGQERMLVTSTFSVLAKLAAKQGRPARVERLLERLASVQAPSTTASLEPTVRRLQAKAALDDIDAVQALFDTSVSSGELASASPADRARLWSQLILTYSRLNNLEDAVKALRQMILDGLTAPLSAVNAILFGYARRADVKTSFEVFSQLVDGAFSRLQPDAGSWTALVLACANARNPSGAAAVVQEMKSSGIAPTREAWTTLMSSFVEQGQWTSAFAVFRYLQEHPSPQLQPDTATLNVMLKACVLTAVPAQDVLELFRSLVAGGMRPNMPTYTLLFQSLCSAGLMDVAEELFLLLDTASAQTNRSSLSSTLPDLPTSMTRVKPDHFIFATMIGGYLRHGEPEKARVLLAEMRARGIAPTTVTTGIVLGARLEGHRRRLHDFTAYGIRSVLLQTRTFLEDSSRLARKKKQRVKVDPALAHGKEAVALLAPVVRAFGKTSMKREAFEVFEEVLGLIDQDSGERDGAQVDLNIELYTTFMDALRKEEDAEEAAGSVRVIWDRLYAAVSKRYIHLRADPASPGPDSPFKRLVDPAQASILCVPFSIYMEVLHRANLSPDFEILWRRLANEGFAFDASNWNVLAQHFARDMQLERAMWIVENVLTVPNQPPPTEPSPPANADLTATFLLELKSIARSSAVGRSPARLNMHRNIERDRQRKEPVDLSHFLSSSLPSPAGDSVPTNAPGDRLETALHASLARRAVSFWHPFGTTLDAIGDALESLTASGTMTSYRRYLQGIRAGLFRVQHGESPEETEARRAELEQNGKEAEADLESVDAAVEVRAALMARYPKTVKAVEDWKTREERFRAEREQRAEMLARGASVG